MDIKITDCDQIFRFSWLLTENNKSGVVDGLKDVYK